MVLCMSGSGHLGSDPFPFSLRGVRYRIGGVLTRSFPSADAAALLPSSYTGSVGPSDRCSDSGESNRDCDLPRR